MEKEKIEIIEAYAECIHNGEVLLERIEKAVEYIKEARKQDFMWSPIFKKELLNILKGKGDE